MKDALIVSVLSVVPRNRGARILGVLARSRVSRWMTRAFVAAYGVDLAEAEGELPDYPTIAALFTRRLRPHARPIAADPGVLVSPVDGTCAAVGTTVDQRIEVAPGRPVSLDALLDAPVDGERDVAVLYLSPRDYHRVHVPRGGVATAWRYVPGTLWPVFPAAVRRIDELFGRNERAIVRLSTDAGPLDVVLVGAFGVGRITLSVCDLVTNTGGARSGGPLADVPVARGEELGVFHLGSTVILVAPAGTWTWTVSSGDPVRLGQGIGRLNG